MTVGNGGSSSDTIGNSGTAGKIVYLKPILIVMDSLLKLLLAAAVVLVEVVVTPFRVLELLGKVIMAEVQ